MKIVRHYDEKELKELLTKALEFPGKNRRLKVKEVKFKVTEQRDAHDRPGFGNVVEAEVEVEEEEL